jgi:xanthine dehydrogenase accessory factor
MSAGLELDALRAAVARHGRVARVVVAETRGSAPREAGAAMLVTPEGQEGTIGGGALEYEAAGRARARLAVGGAEVARLPLGPALGQCCGGAVVLVTEVWDAARLAAFAPVAGLIARPVAEAAGEMPLAVARRLARARGEGVRGGPALVQGWLVEPIAEARHDLWLWGAGHVGRAIAGAMAPLPDWRIIWVDTDPARFPPLIPDGVLRRVAPDPCAIVPEAPPGARHLIVTFSHALDLGLCHALLSHDFGFAGLIGSATKWARFRSRLAALGHGAEAIARITCPIGDPALGKHPQAIAIGVAAELIADRQVVAGRARA